MSVLSLLFLHVGAHHSASASQLLSTLSVEDWNQTTAVTSISNDRVISRENENRTDGFLMSEIDYRLYFLHASIITAIFLHTVTRSCSWPHLKDSGSQGIT